MVLYFLMCAHVMYRLIKANSSQKHTFKKVPNLDSSIQRCSDQLERVLRAQDCGGDDVRVAIIPGSG